MTTQRPGSEFFGASTSGATSGSTAGTGWGAPSSTGTTVPPTSSSSQRATTYTPTAGPAAPPVPPSSTSVVGSVVDRAKADDQQALATLFGQFIPPAEPISESRYLGVMGLWGIGTHSFAALTPQRAATIRVGLLGEVFYQDAPLEYVNSSAVYQPSRLKLYLPVAAWVVLSLLWLISGVSAGGFGVVLGLLGVVGLLLTPFVLRLCYRFVKSGLLLWVREGLSVEIFIDRPRIVLANRYYRLCSELREERIRAVGNP